MLITVTYDGKVLKPQIPLELETNKEYQIELISSPYQSCLIDELTTSADLYAEIYQQDSDLQKLTNIACEDF